MEAEGIIARDFQPEAPYKTSAEHATTCRWRRRLEAADARAAETSSKLSMQESELERARRTIAGLEQNLAEVAIHDDQRNPHGRKRRRPDDDKIVDPVYLDFASNNLMQHLDKHEQTQTNNKALSYKNAQLQQELSRVKNALSFTTEDRDARLAELQSTNDDLVAHNTELLANADTKQEELDSTREELLKVKSEAAKAAKDHEWRSRQLSRDLFLSRHDLARSQRLSESQVVELNLLQNENACLKQELADQKQVMLRERNQLLDDGDAEMQIRMAELRRLKEDKEKLRQIILASVKKGKRQAFDAKYHHDKYYELHHEHCRTKGELMNQQKQYAQLKQDHGFGTPKELDIARHEIYELKKGKFASMLERKETEIATRELQDRLKACEEREKASHDEHTSVLLVHEAVTRGLIENVAELRARLKIRDRRSEPMRYFQYSNDAATHNDDECQQPGHQNSSPRQQFPVPIRERRIYAQAAREIIQDDLSRPATNQHDTDSEHGDEFFDAV